MENKIKNAANPAFRAKDFTFQLFSVGFMYFDVLEIGKNQKNINFQWTQLTCIPKNGPLSMTNFFVEK